MIFHPKGLGVFPRSGEELAVLAIMNSAIYRYLIDMQVPFGSYEVGVISRSPVPRLTDENVELLGNLAGLCVDEKRRIDRANDSSHFFFLPALLMVPGRTLAVRVAAWGEWEAESQRRVADVQRRIDDIVFQLYGLTDQDRREVEEGGLRFVLKDGEGDADEDEGLDSGTSSDSRALVATLLTYAVGCTFGRWDLCFATGERTPPELPDPFTPMPVCSPGMLQGPDGLPLTLSPVGHPIRIDWDGILVDDPDHSDDIIRRVRDVLEVIWKDRADAIEKEACEILGVTDLRDYFRKPGVGGFWDDHIRRYSKSRRKAPIYWLLQSSKKSYALWIYYHRLDKDILFKALLNYVEPKIRREESRLDDLRSQKTALGSAAKGAKKLDKDIDRQDAFLSELRDFEEKLRRAANLHLDPDLNDGVVLNIAALWELVPWKEAKSYWDELMAGKYEWSSIGKQLREKGVVK